MSRRYSVFLAVLSAAGLFACTTAQPPRQETTKAFVGSRACRDCHQAVYNRWQTVDGERGAGSEATPEGDRRGLRHAESARHLQAGGRGFHLREQMEAALLDEAG